MNLTSKSISAYLTADEWIETDHPLVRETAERLGDVRAAYHFVRDEISHSWDVQAIEVTSKASEVLMAGHGICYAKSHLLAALIRALGVPCGIAYQRLTLFDEPEDGHSVHALNTVYLAEWARWIRLDARGNKPGVDARYSEEQEFLAFPV
ncbi:MAG: transglutaminase family protein, partial [Armatimonadota bacterium]